MTLALVTGVSGQDGSYLAERLLGEGVEVHGVVQPGAPAGTVVTGVVPHEADLQRPDEVRRLVEDLVPDVVYNLAGISSVGQSWEQPGLTAAVTGVAAVEIMDAAQRTQERTGRQVRVVQASSAEIFGDADRSPQDESTPVRPVSPYGAAKALAHLSAHVYRQRELHATSCILYNHESPRRPPQFVTRKITRGAARIAQGREQRLVLGNLDARRDWGWAPDYVDAMVRAAAYDRPLDVVVATGVAHSVRDLVDAAFRRAGIDDWSGLVEVDPALVRPADPTVQCGDARLAREQLGWAPTVGFEELVGRMVEADLGEEEVVA